MNGGETANGRRETRQRRKPLFDLSALLRLTSYRFSAVRRQTADVRRGNGAKPLFALSHLLRLTSSRFSMESKPRFSRRHGVDGPCHAVREAG